MEDTLDVAAFAAMAGPPPIVTIIASRLWLGRVDGFDQDEAESESDEGSVILRGLLASECDALEALKFADGLLDACPRLVEYFRKERRSVDCV